MRIDLHLHSSASDGMLAPAALVGAAAGARLDVISLTDHDTVAGVPEALAAAGRRIAVIPGIELSSTHAGRETHVLGYGIDPAHAVLAAFGRDAVDRRFERMRGMIRRLGELGLRVTLEDVLAEGAGAASLGRPHLARALVRLGLAGSVGDAFDRFLADGGPAYLPIELLTPRQAIELIHAAGGRAVWAHPPEGEIDRELQALVGWGLDGIECYRPRNPAGHVRRLLAAARRHGLLVTGGSDWHGLQNTNAALGEFHVGHEQVAGLLAAAGL